MSDGRLGEALYVVSAQILKEFDLEHPEEALNYDVVARCFEFRGLPFSTGDVSLFHLGRPFQSMRKRSELDQSTSKRQ
jgi:hypothetical protein